MKLKLYLDSSVLGAEFDTENPQRRRTTLLFFDRLRRDRHIACISSVTTEEILLAPERIRKGIEDNLSSLELRILAETEESRDLAGIYIDEGALPRGSVADAKHLAIASVHQVDAVVSWNFRHMVNLVRRRAVQAVNLRQAKPLIDIISPEELFNLEGDANGRR